MNVEVLQPALDYLPLKLYNTYNTYGIITSISTTCTISTIMEENGQSVKQLYYQ